VRGPSLILDLGNTNLDVGLYQNGDISRVWRLSTDARRTADEWSVLLKGLVGDQEVAGVAIASVVPTATIPLTEACRETFGVRVLVVDERTPGVRVKVDLPSSVGADRLANAVGARMRYPLPAVVVDLGTGTNIDVVDLDGAYIGGAIAPGVGVATDALLSRAARLPAFSFEAPAHAIGTTTVSCLQSGVVFGFAGMVDALVERILSELGREATVIATGGYAPLIAAQSRTIAHVDMNLTIEGIHALYHAWEEPDAPSKP